MREGVTVAGHRLTGRTRVGEAGVWTDAVSPGGRPSGVLRFDPTAAARARERLVATVADDLRLQRGGAAGLLPVVDLVAARDEVWLITGRAMPALDELLRRNGGHLDAGSVAAVLLETAQTLASVHAAGLTHGAFGAGTVVVAEDGAALLAERGLVAALRGEHVPPERDVAAWVTLARQLAAGQMNGPEADLLHRAITAATAHGLAAARDTLLAGREGLPPGFMTRDRLARAARDFLGPVPGSAPVSGPGPAPVPVPVVPAAGEAVTLLDFPSDLPPGADDDVMMRFGPGVPTETPSRTTAAQIWRSGRTSAVTQARPPAAPPRRRRRTTAWAGTVLLAILIAAVFLWLRQPPAVEAAVSGVDVKVAKKTVRCDGTADFVGVVTTNGGAGTIRYLWIRSDVRKRQEKEQRVSSGDTSVQLPLHWNVTGPGSFKGSATLRVLSPTTTGKPIQDTASFTYKC
ncbi:hypothetical protein [Microbispora amethystogenes]|uniref:Ig-like domain-containing protein n=1 Tax=Microbispora amethystogenes TaxID=1427754 RepID=A0ABQ4F8I9_9ACTN|nr:hypothetical protein [Microbispora amethystogenes]GIH31139.1 hypothetical protein Mam01_13030 [Microbispora amethystogenes]